MIDKDTLRQLGWSDELIDSVSDAAEPLRHEALGGETYIMTEQAYVVSGSVIYSDAMVNNSLRVLSVTEQDETD